MKKDEGIQPARFFTKLKKNPQARFGKDKHSNFKQGKTISASENKLPRSVCHKSSHISIISYKTTGWAGLLT